MKSGQHVNYIQCIRYNMKDEKLVEILEKILEKLEQIDWKLYEFYKSMITEEEEDV